MLPHRQNAEEQRYAEEENSEESEAPETESDGEYSLITTASRTNSNETSLCHLSGSSDSFIEVQQQIERHVAQAGSKNADATGSMTPEADDSRVYLSSTPVLCSGDEDINLPSTSGVQQIQTSGNDTCNRPTKAIASPKLRMKKNYCFGYETLPQQPEQQLMHQTPETTNEHIIMQTDKDYGNDGDAAVICALRASLQIQPTTPTAPVRRVHVNSHGYYLLHNSLMDLLRNELDQRWTLLRSSWCFFRCNFCLVYSKTRANSAFSAFLKHRNSHMVIEQEERNGYDVEVKKQKCFCETTFYTESHLLYHIAAVHLRVLFTCMFCGENYIPREDDVMHYCTRHDIRFNNLKLTRCALCNVELLTTVLAEHVVLEHPRYLMELVLMEWKEEGGFHGIRQLIQTKHEILS